MDPLSDMHPVSGICLMSGMHSMSRMHPMSGMPPKSGMHSMSGKRPMSAMHPMSGMHPMSSMHPTPWAQEAPWGRKALPKGPKGLPCPLFPLADGCISRGPLDAGQSLPACTVPATSKLLQAANILSNASVAATGTVRPRHETHHLLHHPHGVPLSCGELCPPEPPHRKPQRYGIGPRRCQRGRDRENMEEEKPAWPHTKVGKAGTAT